MKLKEKTTKLHYYNFENAYYLVNLCSFLVKSDVIFNINNFEI